jgi:hypothetical protein
MVWYSGGSLESEVLFRDGRWNSAAKDSEMRNKKRNNPAMALSILRVDDAIVPQRSGN